MVHEGITRLVQETKMPRLHPHQKIKVRRCDKHLF